jgi:molybdate transport system ATP-binding protein
MCPLFPMIVKSRSVRALISLRDATFRLGERLIFRNTSWTFHSQEHWAVVGPNGSGKSWFADALRAGIPLVHGEMSYGFRPPRGLTAEQAIGHVAFEDRRIDVHETVVQSRWNSIEEDGALRVDEFLSYERVMEINPFEVVPRRDQGKSRFMQRQRRAIKLLGVAPFLQRALLSLSNGERQRVQWARALCHPLRLLILDEPFTGLDAATRKHFHELLGKLMQTPLRILFVTARPEEIPQGITHVMQVDQCAVVSAGPRRKSPARSKVLNPGMPFENLNPKRQVSHAGSPRAKSGKEQSRVNAAGAFREGQKPLVRLRNVTVRYGEKVILNEVNWTIHPGESWALLGPNGSGKTTLLSLILGDNPQAYMNDVIVFGLKRGHGESIWEIKRQIGWVSPELQLHFSNASSCLAVVVSGFHATIGLYESPTPRQKVAARYWLKRFDMLSFAHVWFSALSLGQQRMVLLARALVKNPELLVLDEPCQGLDPEHRRVFLQNINRLISHRAVTAIYVTHLLEEIPPGIGKVLRLGEGRASVHLLHHSIRQGAGSRSSRLGRRATGLSASSQNTRKRST